VGQGERQRGRGREKGKAEPTRETPTEDVSDAAAEVRSVSDEWER
jgi:hypothetical protein